MAKHNAFIFNFIKNNQNDIARLVDCLYNVKCSVRTYEHLSYEELTKAIDEIVTMDCSVFEYIVVIVLDNTNPCEYLLTPRSKDSHFMLNADLLRRLGENPTMRDKHRLIVLQTNRNYDTQNVYRPPVEATYYLCEGIINEINAICMKTVLKNYWPQPNAPLSPFIRVFCENFEQNSMKTFSELSDGIIRGMQPYGEIPEISTEKSTLVYGMALLKKDCIIDFLSDNPPEEVRRLLSTN